MDKPIPTLKGEDARRFVENMRKAEQSPAPQNEIDRIMENMRKFTHDLPSKPQTPRD